VDRIFPPHPVEPHHQIARAREPALRVRCSDVFDSHQHATPRAGGLRAGKSRMLSTGVSALPVLCGKALAVAKVTSFVSLTGICDALPPLATGGRHVIRPRENSRRTNTAWHSKGPRMPRQTAASTQIFGGPSRRPRWIRLREKFLCCLVLAIEGPRTLSTTSGRTTRGSIQAPSGPRGGLRAVAKQYRCASIASTLLYAEIRDEAKGQRAIDATATVA
jgi:hypothetical protein